MRKSYDRITIIYCAMAGFLAALLLFLLADFAVYKAHFDTVNYLNSIIRSSEEKLFAEVDEDAYVSYSEDPSGDAPELMQSYADFLERISEALLSDASPEYAKYISYYADMVFTYNYTGDYYESNESWDEPSRLGDRLIQIPDVDNLGMSAEARTIHKNSFGTAVIDIPWGNPNSEELYGFGLLNSWWSYAGWADHNHQYRLTFAYSPLKMAAHSILICAIIIIPVAIFIEWSIISYRKRSRNRGRFGELMSSTLATGFSHELKTPLAVIRASVENWDYIDEADRPEYIQKIDSETAHLDTLVDKLLGVGNMSTDTIKLNKQAVDLCAVTNEIIEKQKPMMDERKIKLELVTANPEKCLVQADPELLRIAVGNFMTNAVKYSAGRIGIRISSGPKVRFEISNDGQVLSREAASKVWDLFYKTDASRTDRLRSSGIGLAVTASILKAHKAKYECIPGEKETTFWFEMKPADKRKEGR